MTSAGQLGIMKSSARYKHDIRDMGAKSSALLKLRPVSFRYNNDPANTLQYGYWWRKSVAKVSSRAGGFAGADGKTDDGALPSMLSAMLLNELQKQNSELRNQTATNQRRQAAQVANLRAQMVTMRLSNQRAVAGLKANYETGPAINPGAGWRRWSRRWLGDQRAQVGGCFRPLTFTR